MYHPVDSFAAIQPVTDEELKQCGIEVIQIATNPEAKIMNVSVSVVAKENFGPMVIDKTTVYRVEEDKWVEFVKKAQNDATAQGKIVQNISVWNDGGYVVRFQ